MCRSTGPFPALSSVFLGTRIGLRWAVPTHAGIKRKWKHRRIPRASKYQEERLHSRQSQFWSGTDVSASATARVRQCRRGSGVRDWSLYLGSFLFPLTTSPSTLSSTHLIHFRIPFFQLWFGGLRQLSCSPLWLYCNKHKYLMRQD